MQDGCKDVRIAHHALNVSKSPYAISQINVHVIVNPFIQPATILLTLLLPNSSVIRVHFSLSQRLDSLQCICIPLLNGCKVHAHVHQVEALRCSCNDLRGGSKSGHVSKRENYQENWGLTCSGCVQNIPAYFPAACAAFRMRSMASCTSGMLGCSGGG